MRRWWPIVIVALLACACGGGGQPEMTESELASFQAALDREFPNRAPGMPASTLAIAEKSCDMAGDKNTFVLPIFYDQQTPAIRKLIGIAITELCPERWPTWLNRSEPS